ncbi:MAG: DUF4012 domain-containing protein [Candidatus Magasanikbacteria bacterium]
MKKIKILVIIFLVVLLFLAGGWYFWYYAGNLQKTLVSKLFQTQTTTINGTIQQENIFQDLLGFQSPRYYLLLFLNNTELRPGGGFIGSYGVIKVDKARPEIIKTEGTEILDYSQSNVDLPLPPVPIASYLKTEKWYFRDSNWSPDFALSSAVSLDLYRKEKGVAADDIYGVIGFTPTVISKILQMTGPIKIDGIEFNSDNLVEKLEYEVEYGYKDKGIERSNRKDLLGSVAQALISKMKFDIILNWSKYYALWEQMIAEKQVMVYSSLPEVQTILSRQGWSGETRASSGDYLLWVDANLGALKTDLAVDKQIFYSISSTVSGLVAEAKMAYDHNGKFDWRTSRYRSYARLYVPFGSKLISAKGAMKTDRSLEVGPVDQGIENGRQWFGAFISIEPGKTGELSFKYYLPEPLNEQFKTGKYNLLVQKQLGSLAVKLTLGLDFGKKVIVASPAEPTAKFGDNRYDLTKDLIVDREFSVSLKY